MIENPGAGVNGLTIGMRVAAASGNFFGGHSNSMRVIDADLVTPFLTPCRSRRRLR